jgi:hypothetical protein
MQIQNVLFVVSMNVASFGVHTAPILPRTLGMGWGFFVHVTPSKENFRP